MKEEMAPASNEELVQMVIAMKSPDVSSEVRAKAQAAYKILTDRGLTIISDDTGEYRVAKKIVTYEDNTVAQLCWPDDNIPSRHQVVRFVFEQ